MDNFKAECKMMTAQEKTMDHTELDASQIGLVTYLLTHGQSVVCMKCGKDIYKPYNTTSELAHLFVCPECGDVAHIDPSVDID